MATNQPRQDVTATPPPTLNGYCLEWTRIKGTSYRVHQVGGVLTVPALRCEDVNSQIGTTCITIIRGQICSPHALMDPECGGNVDPDYDPATSIVTANMRLLGWGTFDGDDGVEICTGSIASTTIPGFVLEHLQKHYGLLPRADLVQIADN